jgi:PAS domain S-box-containing protein
MTWTERLTTEHLRAAVERAPVGVLLCERSPETGAVTIVDANRAACDLLGRERGDLAGRDLTEIGHPDDDELGLERMRRLAAGELSSYEATRRMLHASGEARWTRLRVSAVDPPGADPVRLIVHLEALAGDPAAGAAPEELAQNILDAALDAVVSVDAEGRIVAFNPAAERMYGIPADEAIGAPAAGLLVAPESREEFLAGMRRLASGEGEAASERYLLRSRRADGTTFTAEMSVSGRRGERTYLTGHIRDVSDERRLAREHAALGELTRRALEGAEPEELFAEPPRRSARSPGPARRSCSSAATASRRSSGRAAAATRPGRARSRCGRATRSRRRRGRPRSSTRRRWRCRVRGPTRACSTR